MRATLALLTLCACGPRVPPDPMLGGQPWAWTVDRETLPTSTLRALLVGTVELKLAVARQHSGPSTAPIWALVLDHPDQGLVVVDAGYGRRTVTDPDAYPGRTATRLVGLQMRSPVVDALAQAGATVDDVRHVVVTHAHTDHIGGVEDLPDATLWMHEDEWSAAAKRRPLKGYDPLPYADREARLVSFEGTSPYGPFAHHVDLFEDGTVILLPAAGHTAGHLMVLLNTPQGSLLYLGDAAWVDANWQGPMPKGALPRSLVESDWRQGVGVLWKIRAWAERHPELWVVSGHEPADLERIPAWPEPVL